MSQDEADNARRVLWRAETQAGRTFPSYPGYAQGHTKGEDDPS